MEEKEKKTEEAINDEDFLKKVEKAAEKGALKGGKKNSIVSTLITVVIIAVIVIVGVNRFNSKVDKVIGVEKDVEGYDLTLDNNGLLGYTAVDFEEAILGDQSKLKKLEVMKQEITDASTIVDAGLGGLSVFTKTQVITYYGEVVYTVDLSSLTKNSIVFDEESKMITLKIPHAVQEEINIPEDKIQFSDPEKGLLAFGQIEATAEQIYKVQTEARAKMQEKLDADKTIETADRFAILNVWEIYSPIVKGVAKDYSLEVVFVD